MNHVTPLTPDQLYHTADLSSLPFETTAELNSASEIIGQERALEAIRFGIGIQQPGFNLFALGPNGTGKFTTIESYLAEKAPGLPTPRDWCYVHNFDVEHRPNAISLPAGDGIRLRDTMSKLVEDINSVLPATFNSEEYAAQRKQIEESLKEQEMGALETLHNEAREQEVALLRTPAGFAFAPLKGEEVMAPDEFRQLTPAEQKAIEDKINALQEKLQKVMRQVPQWQRTVQAQLKELNEQVALYALEPLFSDLRQAFEGLPEVITYIDAVQADLLQNLDEFMGHDDNPMAMMMGRQRPPVAERYRVNLLVDHSADNGAPVVYEPLPTYQNLVGRVEHVAQMGTLVTDYMLIKPGALHNANGGYLILDMRKLLEQPYAWEGLKNALRTGEIRIESLGQIFSYISTVSLEPEAIALDIKVVLMGERMLYYLLCQHDPDFTELFKVSADFEDEMPRDEDSSVAYARTIATIARKNNLRPLERAAVARVIEHGSRLAEDAAKLSTHMLTISDLLREADFWAADVGHEVITRGDINRALTAQEYRAGRIRERMQESIVRETILIDTQGAVVGQINGLAVYAVGDHAFGKPTRITARVRLGRGEVIDIERRVETGGPLHAKGVLILSGFLMARYAYERPFSINATLVFEQSYGGVDGDSASSTELYALLSALAEVPIRQGLAVTGSVNQHGQVQAIGGVNEKVEGFFDLCAARGLTGDQGVLIPQANVKHLMLSRRVVDAVREGKFAIYPINHIDEGIALLTGVEAGTLDDEGNYRPESINGRVMQRLEAFASKQRELGRRPGENAPANGMGAERPKEDSTNE